MPTNNDQSVLLIISNPPFYSASNRETLDIGLAFSAFDIPVSILFIDDGILQIKSDLNSEQLAQKNLINTFKALEMYDIQDCYVINKDLERFNLSTNALAIKCKTLDKDAIAQFIQAFKTVINL
ncbi:sulfurtransferase complex subunit TusC [Gammaproteobacteria bacterium AS21]